MSVIRGSDTAAAFDPTSNLVSSHVKRVSVTGDAHKKKNLADEEARRAKRRRTSSVAFKASLNAELDPYIVVDEDEKRGERRQSSSGTALTAHVVRRKILVEPAFSKQEKTAGSGEERVRQIIFDQGITDESLVGEIQRGISNEYELGTPQPLRNVHDYVDYSSEALVGDYVKEHVSNFYAWKFIESA